MYKIKAFLALSFALSSLTFATAVGATPMVPSAIAAIAEPAFSTARVTVGRHKALPNKKRIHHQRKSRY